MKTKLKSIIAILFATGLLFSSSSILAQCFSNQGGPPRTEVQSAQPLIEFTQWPGSCSGAPGTALTGVGINQTNPVYLLDILGIPGTNQDVNISCPTCTPGNAIGYRIGGNYVLWHNGDIRNIFVGVGAGNTTYTT